VDVGVRCVRDATVVDQIVPGDDRSAANLRGLCEAHLAAAERERQASQYVAIKVRPPKDDV
jgi:hypothetical protein